MSWTFATDGERKVVECATKGKSANLSRLLEKQRRVRGSLIRALLFGDIPATSLHESGLCIQGALIEGKIDVSGLGSSDRRAPPIELAECASTTAPGFGFWAAAASFSQVRIMRCTLSQVILPDASFSGSFELAECDIAGQVYAQCLKAAGKVAFHGSQVRREAGHCLSALPSDRAVLLDGASIDGSLGLRDSHGSGRPFIANGSVSLLEARIGGSLDAEGAKLCNPTGAAINGDRMTVGGDVLLNATRRNRFIAHGQIRLLVCQIRGQLSLTGAEVVAPESKAAILVDDGSIGTSLYLRAMHDGDVTLEVKGCISANHVRIGGAIHCYGAKLDGGSRPALDLHGSSIEGSILLRGRERNRDPITLRASGGLDFGMARVGQEVDATHLELDGCLNLGGTAIGGDVILSQASIRNAPDQGYAASAIDLRQARIAKSLTVDFASTAIGVIDLRGAHASVLDDNAGRGWKINLDRGAHRRSRQLLLDGFTYDRVAERDSLSSTMATNGAVAPRKEQTAETDRLALLTRGGASGRLGPKDFIPQPFEQLAKVYRAAGNYAAADVIARAKRGHQLACRADGPVEHWLHVGNGFLFGHYYSIRRAITTCLVLWFIATAVIANANSAGSLNRAGQQEPCWTRGAETFQQVAPYALDVLLPLFDLNQQSRCAIAPDAPWWIAAQTILSILGLIVVPLVVLTFSGLARRD